MCKTTLQQIIEHVLRIFIALLSTTYSPKIKHGASTVFVHKHVLSVANSEPVQNTLNRLEPAGDPGSSWGLHEPLVNW